MWRPGPTGREGTTNAATGIPAAGRVVLGEGLLGAGAEVRLRRQGHVPVGPRGDRFESGTDRRQLVENTPPHREEFFGVRPRGGGHLLGFLAGLLRPATCVGLGACPNGLGSGDGRGLAGLVLAEGVGPAGV